MKFLRSNKPTTELLHRSILYLWEAERNLLKVSQVFFSLGKLLAEVYFSWKHWRKKENMLWKAYGNAIWIIGVWLASSGTDTWELTAPALTSPFILVTLPTQFEIICLSLGAVEINIMLLWSLENTCGSLNTTGRCEIGQCLYPSIWGWWWWFSLHVQLFMTPWTVALQAPLSMGFPK